MAKPTLVKIPAPKERMLSPNDDALYAACSEIFQELIAKHMILPNLRVIDEFACRDLDRRPVFDDEKAYQRCITRGAILWCISTACKTDGMFCSSGTEKFLRSPALLFKDGLSRTRSFAPKVLAHRDEVLRPLFDWIQSYLTSFPEITTLSEQLGDLSHHQILEVFSCKSIPLRGANDTSDSGNSQAITNVPKSKPSKRTKASSLFQLNHDGSSTALDLANLILPTYGIGLKIGTLGIVLREALNMHKGLPLADNEIGHMARRSGNLDSSKSMQNPDHINPIREKSIGVTLLLKHIPPQKFTSRYGLSNLLSWMGTGQGYKTQRFLETLPRPIFYKEVFKEVMGAFDVAHKRNDLFTIDHGSKSTSFVAVDDVCIYGTACNLYGSRPTIPNTGGRQLTSQEKFAPYWDKKVQNAWRCLLGDMFEQDPLEYAGDRPTWKAIFDLILQLEISGFNSGLALLQTVNNATFLLKLGCPDPDDVAEWIYSNKDLGAYKTLTKNYGFCISSKTATQVAFGCVFEHLDQHLSQNDKKILHFGPVLVEHLLCKDIRWRALCKGLEHTMEQRSCKAEDEDVWVSGGNDKDHLAFPFPLTISTDLIRNVVKKKGIVFLHL